MEPEPVLEVDSVNALCQSVRHGIGVAAVPELLVAEELKEGTLVALSPNWNLTLIGAYAVGRTMLLPMACRSGCPVSWQNECKICEME